MSFDYNRLASSRSGPPIAVAEIGTAHGGNLKKGLDLVDACADAGADVAKVQVVFAEEILPPEAGLVPLPGGPTALYEVFRRLERPIEFYASLADRAEKRGLGFLASPFGMKSVSLLEDIGVRAWKVASPELNHEPLLRRLAATGLPLILSTGVSREEDIRRALDLISKEGLLPAADLSDRELPVNTPQTGIDSSGRSAAPTAAGLGGQTSGPPVILLHCLTSYPAPENQANLRAIDTLREIFHCPSGLSDHSLDPLLAPCLASAMGAVMVEKHITLSHSGDGLDDPVALTPLDFARMTDAMKRFACAPDDPCRDSILGDLSERFGEKRVAAALGNGSLELAPAEADNYGRTNRSLHAVGALKAGTVLTERNTALLRTEKILRPGLAPRRRQEAYGRRLIRDIESGDGITDEDFE